VGEDGLFADYTVRNSKVDLVAPGTNVFSTVRVRATENNVMASITFSSRDGDEVTVPGMVMHDSREAPYSIAGPLVECYLPTCPGSPGGHVCLIERGHALYSTTATWCQDSGGIAAIIYHGEKNGHFNANMNPTSPVTIPVIATTRSDGKLLLQRSAPGSAVVIYAQVGYSVMSGTSMSCPVASGALAALWQACPRCDTSTLEQCVFVTADDLGEPGHDEIYGYGKVQAGGALACLQRACC
jgi:subtilisin family serine protease